MNGTITCWSVSRVLHVNGSLFTSIIIMNSIPSTSNHIWVSTVSSILLVLLDLCKYNKREREGEDFCLLLTWLVTGRREHQVRQSVMITFKGMKVKSSSPSLTSTCSVQLLIHLRVIENVRRTRFSRISNNLSFRSHVFFHTCCNFVVPGRGKLWNILNFSPYLPIQLVFCNWNTFL